MRERVLFLLIGLCISTLSLSQKNEYQYPAIRFGVSHGFSSAPGMNVNKYLITPGNEEMQLTPIADFKGYTPGFVADFLYHFDFTTNNAGIFTGLEYNYNGISSKYNTKQGGYDMIETHRMHTLGVPIAFKYGPNIWDNQRYVYAGFQFNYILAMSSVQQYNWSNVPSAKKVVPEAYNKTAFGLFFGLNYLAFNVQFDYYPKSVFNQEYKDENGYAIYAGQVEQSFAIKTCINIPYRWLSDQSYWWKRKLRKVPIWK